MSVKNRSCRPGTAGRQLLCGGLMAVLLCLGTAFESRAQEPLVITRDNGGLLQERRRELRAMQSSGRRVEVRGICYSACTLYLGAPGICIDPSAVFGFHGPSWYGNPLSQPQFEYWSNVLAASYREPLKTWFLSEARYSLRDYHRITGAEMIRLGYPQC